jgi:XTP/dITP diphosphohydrolase
LAAGCAGAGSARLCAKLLRELKGVPTAKRTARFTTALAVAAPDGRVLHTAEGVLEGIITAEMRGLNGFGYDPVFYYPPLKKTFAEMSPAEKNRHSHRRRALQELLKKLKS